MWQIFWIDSFSAASVLLERHPTAKQGVHKGKNWAVVLQVCCTVRITKKDITFFSVSGRIGKVVASHAAVARSSPAEVCTDLYYGSGAQGVLPMRVRGATSQLDLPSLTPLSVAGCGWLQLGVPHWAA